MTFSAIHTASPNFRIEFGTPLYTILFTQDGNYSIITGTGAAQVAARGTVSPGVFASSFTLRETFDGTKDRFYCNGQLLAAITVANASDYTAIAGIEVVVDTVQNPQSISFQLSNFTFTPLP